MHQVFRSGEADKQRIIKESLKSNMQLRYRYIKIIHNLIISKLNASYTIKIGSFPNIRHGYFCGILILTLQYIQTRNHLPFIVKCIFYDKLVIHVHRVSDKIILSIVCQIP